MATKKIATLESDPCIEPPAGVGFYELTAAELSSNIVDCTFVQVVNDVETSRGRQFLPTAKFSPDALQKYIRESFGEGFFKVKRLYKKIGSDGKSATTPIVERFNVASENTTAIPSERASGADVEKILELFAKQTSDAIARLDAELDRERRAREAAEQTKLEYVNRMMQLAESNAKIENEKLLVQERAEGMRQRRQFAEAEHTLEMELRKKEVGVEEQKVSLMSLVQGVVESIAPSIVENLAAVLMQSGGANADPASEFLVDASATEAARESL